MKKLLMKEIKLSSSMLSFLFILFAFMTFLPGYPILVGGFFVTLGIFQSFQKSRETNDILYTALLPIKKSDAVKSKFLFCIFIELSAFLISALITVIRMSLFSGSEIYRNNAMMNANLVFLGFLLLIFGLFNLIFIYGFFRTGYYFTKPFVIYIIVALLTVGIAETLHHLPNMSWVNSFGFENITRQSIFLLCGIVLYVVLTIFGEKFSKKRFEKIDL